MTKKIEYEDKVAIQNDESVAEINKVTDADMNEIKEVINNNAEELEQAQKDIQNNTESIAEINAKDTAQDSLIEELQTKVVNLEAENTSLKNQIPSGEATGNPIHLADSSDLPCEIAVVGNSEQETRSGKNLANISNFSVHGGNGHTFPKTITNLTANTTYTLSFTKTRKSGVTISNKAIYGWAYIDFYNGNTKISSMSNGSATSNFESGSLNFIKTIQTPENCNKIIVCFDNNNGDTNTNTEVSNVQLEEGSIATDYEQYGASPSPEFESPIVTVGQNGSVETKVDNGLETTDTNYQSYTKVLPIQKEFVKIGDVEDTFVKVEGKWYEAHYHPKIVFDGTENILFNASDNVKLRVTLQLDNLKENTNQSSTIDVLSNSFKGVSANNATTNLPINSISVISNKRLFIILNISVFSNVETFKTWLAEKYANGAPIIAYPTLKEPELIECTTEQEEILNGFHTYKGITNISADGIATLKVNYKKDLETIINKLSATSVAK